MSLDNAFNYADVAPFLERGSVLDNQRAVTVKGTFLQNRGYLDLFFYREMYTVVEIEMGSHLSALYEATPPWPPSVRRGSPLAAAAAAGGPYPLRI